MERLTMTRGDSYQLVATLYEPDGTTPWTPTGTPVITATAKHRVTDADGDAVFTKALGSGITRLANVVTVQIDPADTNDLTGRGATILRADIQVKDDAGTATVPYELEVEPDVTRTP
jgi:hypothetical protein